jgi:hypothetical protein
MKPSDEFEIQIIVLNILPLQNRHLNHPDHHRGHLGLIQQIHSLFSLFRP